VSLLVLPAVTSISPIHGPAAGGTTVTIAGSGFTGATAVSFGSAVVNNPTVNGATEITVVSPPGNGTVDVQVTTPNGTSDTGASDEFTYDTAVAGPTISSISPASGPAAGGTNVTIMGTGFIMGSTSVSFGGTAASNVIVVSDTQITATSPGGSGTVNVTVTTPNGTASAPFTYT